MYNIQNPRHTRKPSSQHFVGSNASHYSNTKLEAYIMSIDRDENVTDNDGWE